MLALQVFNDEHELAVALHQVELVAGILEVLAAVLLLRAFDAVDSSSLATPSSTRRRSFRSSRPSVFCMMTMKFGASALGITRQAHDEGGHVGLEIGPRLGLRHLMRAHVLEHVAFVEVDAIEAG